MAHAIPTIEEEMAAMNSMVVSQYGYTRGQLQEAFNQVCNPNDWKAEICASCAGEAVMVITEAIIFFTATVPTVTLDTNTMRYTIRSEGYRRGPAGNH